MRGSNGGLLALFFCGFVDLGEDVVQWFCDAPAWVMPFHFREVADVTDLVAGL